MPPSAPASVSHLSTLTYATLITGTLIVALMVRLSFTLSGNFPLHDGGLFFQMTRDLQASGYRLPAMTTYNGASIPFAYPPLGMYAAAVLDDVTPVGLVNLFRFLPLLESMAMLVAFLLLARRVQSTRVAVAVSFFTFAMMPRTFLWMIMGGGLTRSLGLTFAILTIYAAHKLYTRRDARFGVLAALAGSLAVLSHLEMAWFAVFSTVLLFFAYGRHRHGVISSVAVAAATLLLTAPWWATVIAYHGLTPFVGAIRAGGSQSDPFIGFIQYRFTNEPLFPMFAAVALVGVVACVARKKFLLPAWFFLALLFDQRAFGTVATVPMALLTGVAVTEAIIPLAQGWTGGRPGRAPPWLVPAVLTAGVLYAILSALLAGPLLSSMSHDERDAMAWAAHNTPQDSRFLLVTGDSWFADRTSEWFPVLVARESIATTQGYEWLPGSTFARRIKMYDDAQKCASKDGACIDVWERTYHQGYNYIYIPKLAPHAFSTPSEDEHECCAALRASLLTDPEYVTVFDGPGATIFQRRS